MKEIIREWLREPIFSSAPLELHVHGGYTEFSSGREGTTALASNSHTEEVAFCSATDDLLCLSYGTVLA